MGKLFLYFRTLRPIDSAVCILISLVTAIGISFLFGLPLTLDIFVKIFIIITISSFYAFASNNFFDKKIDSQNNIKDKRNPSRGLLLKQEMIGIISILFIFWFLFTYIWFPSLLPIVLLVMIDVTLYSKYFKLLPIVDLASHFISVFYLFLFPALVLNLPTNIILIGAIGFFGISNLGELNNQFLDFEFDKKSKIKTTAVFFGKKVSKIISYISIILVLVSIIWISIILNRFLPLVFSPLLAINILRIKNNFLGENYEKIYIVCIFLALLVSGGLFLIGF